MKRILLCIMFCLTLLCIQQKSSAQTTGSYVPAYIQEQPNWCWAACGTMIYWAYHTGTLSQCSFVAKSRDEEDRLWFDCNNLPSSSISPCTNPGYYNYPQSLYTCGGSIENVLDAYGISSTGYGHGFSTSELTTAMSARKICIARWGWNSGGGHFVVVNRYKSGNVYFNNPLSGAVIWTYSTFNTANNKGTWTHTLRLDNGSVYGTVYTRSGETSKNPVATDQLKESIENRMALNLYPNPTVDNVTVMLNAERTAPAKLIITNSSGMVVYEQLVSEKANYTKINVSRWARGLYIVKLAGTNLSQKMVLQ